MDVVGTLTSPKALIVIAIVLVFGGVLYASDSADAADWYNENCVGLFAGGSQEDCDQAWEYADAWEGISYVCCGIGGILLIVGTLQLVRDRKAQNVELENKVESLQSELASIKQDENTE